MRAISFLALSLLVVVAASPGHKHHNRDRHRDHHKHHDHHHRNGRSVPVRGVGLHLGPRPLRFHPGNHHAFHGFPAHHSRFFVPAAYKHQIPFHRRFGLPHRRFSPFHRVRPALLHRGKRQITAGSRLGHRRPNVPFFPQHGRPQTPPRGGSSSCTYWCKTAAERFYCCDDDPFGPPPPEEHPGVCPAVRPSCPKFRLHSSPPAPCHRDSDCEHVDKCCYDVCLELRVCKPSQRRHRG